MFDAGASGSGLERGSACGPDGPCDQLTWRHWCFFCLVLIVGSLFLGVRFGELHSRWVLPLMIGGFLSAELIKPDAKFRPFLHLGAASNLLVICANGGYMPVIAPGFVGPREAPWMLGTWEMPLSFLADIIPIGIGIASVGDLWLAAGCCVWATKNILGRRDDRVWATKKTPGQRQTTQPPHPPQPPHHQNFWERPHDRKIF